MVLGGPELLARLGVEAGHLVLARAAGEEHDVVVEHQRRRVVGGQRQSRADRLGRPFPLARLAIGADDLLAVVEDDVSLVGAHRHRRDGRLHLPQRSARLGVDGQHNAFRLVPGALLVHSLVFVPADGVFPRVAVGPRRRGIDQQEQHAIRVEDLLGRLALVVGAERLARGRVEGDQRLVEPERRVDDVTDRHQAPRQERRAGLQRPKVCVPQRDVALPEDRAVERVAGDQLPFGRQLDRRPRSLVEDVEHPAAGRNHRA